MLVIRLAGVHLNAEAGLPPHTDNTHLADPSQLGRGGGGGGAPLLYGGAAFRVRRDKAAWSFCCSARLKPPECEKGFNAVPLGGERSGLSAGGHWAGRAASNPAT